MARSANSNLIEIDSFRYYIVAIIAILEIINGFLISASVVVAEAPLLSHRTRSLNVCKEIVGKVLITREIKRGRDR